ncbi:LacI family DNA-binding transcriptional regulator [Neptunicella sp. SCSIO 80796]|uniref:LacI family DNA-binding transcriptional regulator n=1 Tax=Neptunicella plasticusilytica TaxID=3117012 RepID=UPI003A4D28AD
MLSIKEIAKLADVCPATVSRVLRHPHLVSQKKRDKVSAVIKQTGYVPNNLAVNLRNTKTFKLMAIIPEVIRAYNSVIIRSIEDIAIEHGYSLLLGDTQSLQSREKSFADMARSREVDGIILFCSRFPFEVDPAIPVADQLPPIVHACESTDMPGVPKVNIDNLAAAKEATDYLLSLGHKRIGVVAGHSLTPSTESRLAGYRSSLQEANIKQEPALISTGNYDLQMAAEATQYLMSLVPRPTAIFAFSDEMAIGCLSALHKLKVKVPEQVSVLGFDGISYAPFLHPALSTVAQPLKEIGKSCMELLLPQLNGEKMQDCNKILSHQLVIRESTGPVCQK